MDKMKITMTMTLMKKMTRDSYRKRRKVKRALHIIDRRWTHDMDLLVMVSTLEERKRQKQLQKEERKKYNQKVDAMFLNQSKVHVKPIKQCEDKVSIAVEQSMTYLLAKRCLLLILKESKTNLDDLLKAFDDEKNEELQTYSSKLPTNSMKRRPFESSHYEMSSPSTSSSLFKKVKRDTTSGFKNSSTLNCNQNHEPSFSSLFDSDPFSALD